MSNNVLSPFLGSSIQFHVLDVFKINSPKHNSESDAILLTPDFALQPIFYQNLLPKPAGSLPDWPTVTRVKSQMKTILP